MGHLVKLYFRPFRFQLSLQDAKSLSVPLDFVVLLGFLPGFVAGHRRQCQHLLHLLHLLRDAIYAVHPDLHPLHLPLGEYSSLRDTIIVFGPHV